MQPEPVKTGWLENLPIAFFSVVMGLAGLTIAWENAQRIADVNLHVNAILVGLTTAVFAGLAVLYAVKLIRHPEAVAKELRHPVKLSSFPTISIGLLLLATAYLPLSLPVSQAFWMVGTLLHLLFTLYVVNVWMHHEHFEVQHMNPAWFIPAVGNVLVPPAGVPLGFTEISWFFFSIGILFWVILMTIIFYRVLFHNPIDRKLMPTLFILIAPPAVGFIAYLQLTGEVDSFARILYYSGLFLTLLLLTQAARFTKLAFSLSWWAYSFPLAAIAIASMLMYEHTGRPVQAWIAGGLLLVLTAVVMLLVVRTVDAAARRRICVPDT